MSDYNPRGLLWLLAWLARPLRGVRAALTNPRWPGEPDPDAITPTIYITRRGNLLDVETVWLESRSFEVIPGLSLASVRAYLANYPHADVRWPERDE